MFNKQINQGRFNFKYDKIYDFINSSTASSNLLII